MSRQKIKRRLGIGLLIGGLVAAQSLWGGLVKASSLLEGDQLIKINSYEDLVKVLKEKHIITKDSRSFYKYNMEDVMNAPSKASNTESTDGASSTGSYSTTNVQVEGVDEADTLKNDGRYIYQKIGDHKIAIVDTKGQLKTVSIIKAKAQSNIFFDTMFLDNNKLIVIGQRQQIQKPTSIEIPRVNGKRDTYYRDPYKYFSILQIYDLSDKSAPKLMREVEVEGHLNAVRKIDQTIYMLTHKDNSPVFEEGFSEEDILPLYKDSLVGDVVKTITPENIWYQPWKSAQSYTLITALQIDEKQPIEVQGVLGATDEIYMNEKALYLTSSRYPYYTGSTTTTISKYNIDRQKVTYAVSGHVKGTILNQFSMDEYKGKFRIATTDYATNTSAVYILNSQLKVIGRLENLAPGERIYSVRFTGEKGYVVTFKQVDPLFVIDLSIPAAPKVLGELKIPGFSQYLHPIGDELVVGIGRSTSDIITRDEKGNERVTGVIAAGIKLSLFDVKDPRAPKEINHIILGTSGSYSGATENHKMVTVHSEKQLLAIPIFIRYEEVRDIKHFTGAYVFGIKNGKLVGEAKLGKIGSQNSYYNSTDRVCYIGDKLYFLYDNKINQYGLESFSRIQTIQLD